MGNIKILKSKDIKLEWDGALGRADLLPGACPTVKTYKCVLKAGNEYVPELYSRADRFQFFVFINASGFVVSGNEAWNITDRAVFAPFFDKQKVRIKAGKTDLEFYHITSLINEEDEKALKFMRIELPKFKLLKDCWQYTEGFTGDAGSAVKSHFVLEHRLTGRCSMGWNVGEGPTFIGQHVHEGLQQWYFVLQDSTFTYIAGDEKIPMSEGDVSHTPCATSHGSESAAGEKIDYFWFELADKGYRLENV
ncbi:cupin domain-containing protein [Youxingia wuxianensis]|uniref:Cupin domain-containing protein n=1 Tax=Youxingia wuxianensis TaxID=2763678 RepID=A0A926IH06_9FIRM|nr:cupin domain-containing protein [Youxingia wuxianensis]MBC8584640.1 hypothetical protein [Youxingia wuxianensis]